MEESIDERATQVQLRNAATEVSCVRLRIWRQSHLLRPQEG